MDTIVRGVEKSLPIDSAAFSDRGKKRKLNQDAIFYQTGRTSIVREGLIDETEVSRSMRYDALACDFDETLAWDGLVSAETIAALERVLNY